MKKYIFATLLGATLFSGFISQDSVNFQIDNFEDANNENLKKAYWYNFQDSKSVSKFSMVDSGANSSKHCLLFQHELKTGEQYPYAGLGTKLNEEGTKVDLSNYDGIRFVAKGKGGAGMVQLEIEGTSKEFNHYGAGFSLTENWKEYEIPFAVMRQSWGTAVPWKASDVISVQFAFTNMRAPIGQLYLDDVEFYKSPATK